MDQRDRVVTAFARTVGCARIALLATVALFAGGCGHDEAPMTEPIPVSRSRPARGVVGVAVAATAPVPDIQAAVSSTPSDPMDTWISQLASADPATRQAAAVSLGLAGAAAREAVAPLTDMLDDTTPRTRQLAAQALGRIGPEAMPAYSRLEALAADETNAEVRAEAATALALLRPATAAQAVVPSPPLPPSLPAVAPLDPVDDMARAQDLRQASAFGTLTRPGVDDLVRNLRDGDASIRREAATSLGVIGSHSPTRVGNPATIGRVPPPAAFGPEAENAIEGLGDLVAQDADATVRLAAATALARIGAPAEAARGDLESAAAGDADERVRLAAAQALAEIRRRY